MRPVTIATPSSGLWQNPTRGGNQVTLSRLPKLSERPWPRRYSIAPACCGAVRAAGKEAKLCFCFMGHALMENRNGLVVDACLTEANGHAERIARCT
jgi:hypothetical protein